MITKRINKECSCPIHWAGWKKVSLFLLVMFVASGGTGLINQATTVVAPFMGQDKRDVIAQFIGPMTALADELEVKEDMTVGGTGGTENNPNVWVKGYSAFATTTTNAGTVTSGAGSVYMQGNLEVDGAAYLDGQVIFGDPAATEAVFMHNQRSDASANFSGNLTVDGTITAGTTPVTITSAAGYVLGSAVSGDISGNAANITGTINLTSQVSGILPILNGGTGSSTQNFVDLTTAQSIGGNKTFTGALSASSITLAGEALENVSNAAIDTVFLHNQRSDASSNFSGNVILGDSSSDTITFNAVAGSNLNMNNYLIENIGAGGTDFTSGGGLIVAGNVGIGTTGPTEKLEIAGGNLKVGGTITATGAISGSNLSGTNTGDQTITLTGDVTGSGTGSFAATISADAVALGTDTTGNYVGDVASGSGITVTGTAGEGYTETVKLGGALTDASTSLTHTSTAANDPLIGITLTPNAGTNVTQNVLKIASAITTTTTDTTVDSLILLDNADTSTAGSTVVTDAIKITSSGMAGGVVDAIDVSDANITNAINIGANNIVTSAATIASTELDRLDGKDAALVDVNDAVNTAITGVGTLGSLAVSGATSTGSLTVGGNVGIGTSSPDYLLDIYKAGAPYIRAKGTGDASNFSVLSLDSDETTDKRWVIAHSQQHLNDLEIAYHNGTAWSTKVLLQDGGNVGIGTTGPGAKLDVVGGLIRGDSGLTISAGTVSLPATSIADIALSANVSLLGQSIESAEITDLTITNADISATAGIVTSKLADSTALTDAMTKRHTQGTDTTLGTMTANIAMGSNKITGLAEPASDQDATTKYYVDNAIAGLSWKEAVIDKDLATPPVSPLENDRYLISSTGATGAWLTKENNYARYHNAAWVFEAPEAGDAVFTEDEKVAYTWNGTSWVAFTGASAYVWGYGLTNSGTTINIDTTETVDLTTAQVLTNKTLSTGTVLPADYYASTYVNEGQGDSVTSPMITNGEIVNADLAAGSFTNITGVGTLTAGTWNANAISTSYTSAKDTTDDSWTGTGDVYTTSGNVGIGETTPTAKVHVVGGSTSGDYAAKFYCGTELAAWVRKK